MELLRRKYPTHSIAAQTMNIARFLNRPKLRASNATEYPFGFSVAPVGVSPKPRTGCQHPVDHARWRGFCTLYNTQKGPAGFMPAGPFPSYYIPVSMLIAHIHRSFIDLVLHGSDCCRLSNPVAGQPVAHLVPALGSRFGLVLKLGF